MTVRELLYFASFPEDPIADWSKAQVTAITEKYKRKLAIYEEAWLRYKHPDLYVYEMIYCRNANDVEIELETRPVRMLGSPYYGTNGGAGAYTSLSINEMRRLGGSNNL
jgi:hypothetical protein